MHSSRETGESIAVQELRSLVQISLCKCVKYRVCYATVGFDTAAAHPMSKSQLRTLSQVCPGVSHDESLAPRPSSLRAHASSRASVVSSWRDALWLGGVVPWKSGGIFFAVALDEREKRDHRLWLPLGAPPPRSCAVRTGRDP